MSQSDTCIFLKDPEETAFFAKTLGKMLKAGDTLLLEGGIGAGKTHLARSLIQSLLKEPEDIPSPTFTLVQIYEAEACEIWHADLYRLTDPSEVIELGLSEAFEEAICIVEWPDRLGDLKPENAVTLSLSPTKNESERCLRIADPTNRFPSLNAFRASA